MSEAEGHAYIAVELVIWAPWLFSKEWQRFIKPLNDDPRFSEMRRTMNVPDRRK